MRVVSCHRGVLQTVDSQGLASDKVKTFATGLAALDGLLPGECFGCGAVHELLTEPDRGLALSLATLLARSAAGESAIAWCDPAGEVYPPALAAAGISLERLFLLRPKSAADLVWAAAECLRCPGVGATVAHLPRLSRIEARRLQLAAEEGGGVGILLRPFGPASREYAAATRWLVKPAPGERTLQRWTLQLIHGHGGRIGQRVILEVCRATGHVRASETVGDRSGEAQKSLQLA